MEKQRTLLMVLFLSLLALTSCKIFNSSEERNGTILTKESSLYDLLINVNEMPEGWKSYEPFKPRDDLCYYHCAKIQYDAEMSGQSRATHSVFLYKHLNDAKRVYEEKFIPLQIGQQPPTWDYSSDFADEYHFSCYYYKDITYPLCSWLARYDHYIVKFSTWLVPTKMSLSDLENVIRIIDIKMTPIKK